MRLTLSHYILSCRRKYILIRQLDSISPAHEKIKAKHISYLLGITQQLQR